MGVLRSYHITGTLTRLISFICHSYENTRGVGGFFPFWSTLSGKCEGNSPRAIKASTNPCAIIGLAASASPKKASRE